MKTVCSFLFGLMLASWSAADDWPQWRGPERTGIVSWAGPRVWPEKLTKLWSVEVGEGHSSPTVAGEHVYQFSRQRDREFLRALALADGTVIWEVSVEAPYRMNPAATSHGKGPKSTPLVVDGKVFTLGIQGILSCHDAASGELVWRRDSASSPLYGHATSPLIADGKLIVHLGGPGRGALTALAPETGRPLWRYGGDGPGYSSPLVVELGDTRQIVTQTDAHIVSVSLESGELLWSLPFTTPYDQNIVTPILYGDTLIFSGLDQRTFAVSGTPPKEIWSTNRTFYMSTPVLINDRLIGFSDKRSGHFIALDPKTGETLGTGPPRQGDNAALVVAGEWLLTLTDGAELSALGTDASDFEPVRTYTVAESPTWAHPVPTSRGILIKDRTRLTIWSLRP